MQLLPIVIALVLGILALVFVLYPLYQRNLPKTADSATFTEEPATENGRPRSNHLHMPLANSENAALENEQAAKNAIQEVELDYQLGNISESDYHSLRERYLRRAVVAMKSRYDQEQELHDTIEP